MAKYRRRRIYRKRKNWSPNINRIHGDYNGILPGERFMDVQVISQNPAQNNASVPIQYTVKNVEVSCQLESKTNSTDFSVEDIEFYIVYVPEGYAISMNLPFEHPEWIMAYKFVGSSFSNSSATTSNAQVPKIRTRLSRKLKSGDSIMFLIIGNNRSSSTINVNYDGLIRWWTKAN